MDLVDDDVLDDVMDSSNFPIRFDGDNRNVGMNQVPRTPTETATTALRTPTEIAATAKTSTEPVVGASISGVASRRPPTIAATKKARLSTTQARNMSTPTVSTPTTSTPTPSTPEPISSGDHLFNSLGFTIARSSNQQESQGQSSQPIEIDDDVEEMLVSKSKKRRASTVWKEFKEVEVLGQMKAQCIYCHKYLEAKSKNGTKSLHFHLRICTMKKIKMGGIKGKTLEQPPLRLNSQEGGNVSVENYMFDQDVARKALTAMIVLHEYPLCIVDHVGFRRFVSALQPLFKMVTRDTIRKDIIDAYKEEKKKALQYICGAKSRVAITTDLWTSNNQRRGYMAVTAHFVDDSWSLRNIILRFIYVPAPHTAEVICEQLYESLVEWNLDGKISTVIVDNCTTNDAVISDLIKKIGKNKLLLEGKLLHMWCAAHILNLIVKDGLEVIQPAIAKFRESIAFWTATPKRIEKFEEIAKYVKTNGCAVPTPGIGELRIATILDPRFKTDYLLGFFEILFCETTEVCMDKANDVRNSLYELMKDYQGEEDEDNTELSVPPLDNSGFLFTISAHVATRRPAGIKAKSELDRYLEDELIPVETDNFHILDWWKVAGTRYPTLRKIARDIFAIPVSSVVSESAFSTSVRVLSEHRSRLTPEILEALMCSQDWLRNKYKDVEIGDKPETFWSCLQEIQEGVEGLTLC